MVKRFKIKIFADGADLSSIKELNSRKYISGFTTNPTLMKKAGVKDYKKFAFSFLKLVKNKPISFEVFADNLYLMKKQAREIATWGKNVYVKIPITNSKGKKTIKIIKELSNDGIKLNITALLTKDQVKETIKALNKQTESIISIFSGRIADTGVSPEKIIKYSIIQSKKKNIKVLWASTRETYNIFEAERMKAHIITVPHNILSKFNMLGMSLKKLSLSTVQSFLRDSIKAGFKINI